LEHERILIMRSNVRTILIFNP